jgi:uncharacterized protein
MHKQEIEQLIQHGSFPYDQKAKATLIETSISFVILKGAYVYKIKKEIKLTFLNFSSLKLRKFYCYEELRLNKRLALDMYIDVVPISKIGNQYTIGKTSNAIIEYAVLMKRIDTKRQLDILVHNKTIKPKSIKRIAIQIAQFHKKEKSLKLKYDPFFLSREFADIQNFQTTIHENVGSDYADLVKESIQLSNMIVELMQDFIKERVNQGYFKDCHGDLHSKNIFVDAKPIIFDCIEFKTEFREIDVLNEIAFLCMDLECSKNKKMSDLFLSTYLKETAYPFNQNEQQLFIYFKAYRACIRAKVAAIALSQHPTDKTAVKEVKQYTIAMAHYLIAICNIL